ncbi:MAG: GNAT family N-acetyltransferase [Rhodoferax sp.]|nr:GNAT family N-acetyltransferase [Rhodoferax sp.]
MAWPERHFGGMCRHAAWADAPGRSRGPRWCPQTQGRTSTDRARSHAIACAGVQPWLYRTNGFRGLGHVRSWPAGCAVQAKRRRSRLLDGAGSGRVTSRRCGACLDARGRVGWCGQAIHGKRQMAKTDVQICRGYVPGAIGRIAEMHAHFYSRHAGFGSYFEAKVASGVGEFCSRLANPRSGLWVALLDQRVVGSIAIDGQDMGDDTAHLRWFITDGPARGSGIGNSLLARALEMVDTCGFRQTRLWTFSGLDKARHMYEMSGFVLEREALGTQWGEPVVEQLFVRPGRSSARSTQPG